MKEATEEGFPLSDKALFEKTERLIEDYRASVLPEGEAGYVDSNFFRVLFGGEADFESDYAVFLSASLEAVYEAGVFVCRDDTSLLYAEELLRDRISLLSKMGYAGSPILIRRGDTVFYSTLPDARRAEDIWRDIKIR